MDASNKPDGGTGSATVPPLALPAAAVAVQQAPAQLPAAASSVPLSLPSVVVPSLQPHPPAPAAPAPAPPPAAAPAAPATEAAPGTPLRGEMDIQCFVEAVVQGRASISHTVEPSEIPRSQKKIGLRTSISLCLHSLCCNTSLWLTQQEREHQEQCSGLWFNGISVRLCVCDSV